MARKNNLARVRSIAAGRKKTQSRPYTTPRITSYSGKLAAKLLRAPARPRLARPRPVSP